MSPFTGATPPLQFPPTDQRLFTAPVHDFGPPTTVTTTSLPEPPAYVICICTEPTLNDAPSGSPANVPETVSAPSLLMIVNDVPFAGINVGNVIASVGLLSVTVPFTASWSCPVPGVEFVRSNAIVPPVAE